MLHGDVRCSGDTCIADLDLEGVSGGGEVDDAVHEDLDPGESNRVSTTYMSFPERPLASDPELSASVR